MAQQTKLQLIMRTSLAYGLIYVVYDGDEPSLALFVNGQLSVKEINLQGSLF